MEVGLLGKFCPASRLLLGDAIMNAQVERASALLFPEHGRQALDVKFFCEMGSSADALAEQIVVSMASLDDDSTTIENVDAA